MRNYAYYPFTAIVGQEQVKQALCIAMVNPKVGGLLIGGRPGTGKSVIVRSIRELLNPRKLLNLPLNITEDMLFGSIDMEKALRFGVKQFSQGLLGKANGQILYIDDINLLRPELLSSIVNIQAEGINRVERESVSYEEQTVFSLIGTMNADNGTLSNQLLDRFGMYVESENIQDVEQRKEIIRRTLEFQINPARLIDSYSQETTELKQKLTKAVEILPRMQLSEAMLILAAQMCAQAFCAGHRAELFLLETAKAIAAIAGRCFVLPKDLEAAAVYVLPHRMRKPPEEAQEETPDEKQNNEENNPQEQDNSEDVDGNSDDEIQENAAPPLDMPNNTSSEDSSSEGESKDNDTNEFPSNNKAPEELIAAINNSFKIPNLVLDLGKSSQIKRGSGKRSITRTDLKQGRYVRAEQPQGKVEDLAFDATIRAAAPFQSLRPSNGCALTLYNEDLRQKVREKRIGNTFLFAVDASGSMGARERMGAVKGAIHCMLQEAYQKRDRVGMLAFRRDKAEMLLPITRSVDLAQRCLSQMPTGGKTPLAEGLALAYSTLDRLVRADQNLEPILILVTDGRANSKLNDNENPVEAAIKMAQYIRKAKITALVLDTEKGYVKLGLAKTIAREMGANYYHIDKLSQENILRIVRNIGD
ncbi:MAG: VWA domain-containing protein [Phascolarctobacterium sp.]|nr:VWA domain-containing protein [Phascolarctobacterium sp.]